MVRRRNVRRPMPRRSSTLHPLAGVCPGPPPLVLRLRTRRLQSRRLHANRTFRVPTVRDLRRKLFLVVASPEFVTQHGQHQAHYRCHQQYQHVPQGTFQAV